MRTNNIIVLLAALIAVTISACVKNPENSITNLTTTFQTHAVWVVNEGDWGHGNSTLDCFEPDTGFYHDNVFEAVNHMPLGDNANDAVIGRGDSLYIVVNNSDTIRLLNRRTGVQLHAYAMPAGTKPYKMVMINDSIAAISGYGANSLILFNRWTGTISRTFPTGANPEGVAFTGSTICVCAPGLNAAREIDLIRPSDGSTASVQAGDDPLGIIALNDSSAVALCGGNWSPPSPASLVFINTDRAAVSTTLPVPGSPTKMALDGRVLYVPVDSVVYLFDMQTRTLRDSFKIDRVAYGITVDNATHLVYLTDAKNFAQRGDLSVFDDQMRLLSRMPTGINPGTLLVLH